MKTSSKNMVPIMVALIAISVGAAFAISSSNAFQSLTLEQPSAKSGAFMTGHVEAVVRDNEGVIKAYRQADNAIVIGGLEVLADQLFHEWTLSGNPDTGLAMGNNHTNTTGGRFGWMNIGNGTTIGVSATQTGLECPLELGYPGCGAAQPACQGVAADIWNTRSVERTNPPAGVAQINVTAIATFDGADCESNAIREAALWNNATSPAIAPAGQMFATNEFGSVTLTSTDSLELTWRFTFTDQ
jgi:hypothetical protein